MEKTKIIGIGAVVMLLILMTFTPTISAGGKSTYDDNTAIEDNPSNVFSVTGYLRCVNLDPCGFYWVAVDRDGNSYQDWTAYFDLSYRQYSDMYEFTNVLVEIKYYGIEPYYLHSISTLPFDSVSIVGSMGT